MAVNNGRLALGLIVTAGAAIFLVGMAQDVSADTYWTIGVPSSSSAIGPPQATTNVDVTYYGPAATPSPIVTLNKEASDPAPIMSLPIDSGATGVFHYDDQLQGSQISDSAVYYIETPSNEYEVFQIGPIAVGTSSVEATRLIPEQELGDSYRVGTWKDPGTSLIVVAFSQDMTFFTVVSIKDSTQVTVVTSCRNAGSAVPPPAPGAVYAMTPGTAYSYTVNRGQALHVESPSAQNAYARGGLISCDLTGSTVTCSTSCAVWAGNNCMRAQDTTCDLAYAQMLPDASVGQLYVVCASLPSGTGQLDAMMIRSVSGPANVNFGVPVGSGPAGPWSVGSAFVTDTAFSLFYFKADTVITSDAPIHFIQYMVQSTLPVPMLGILIPGANLIVTSQPARGWGDPAQMQVRPLDQGTFDHWLYAPESFKNYLYVGHPMSAILSLDGSPLLGTRPIGTTGYGCTTTLLDGQDSNTGNTHHLVDLTGGAITGQMVGLGLSAAFMYDTGSPPPIIVPPPPPQASFKAIGVDTGCGIHPIDFTDSSTAGAYPIVAWFWDFGDGTISYDQNPSHTYPGPGDYIVTLTVTDDMGFQSSSTSVVTATEGGLCMYPTIPQDNAVQPRAPHDGVEAEIAEADVDGDGIANAGDNCVFVANADQLDFDLDAAGDECDVDKDGDGVMDAADNCVDDPNSGQADLDADGDGNVCDEDLDGDTILNVEDNCRFDANLDQADGDANQIGDLCEEHLFVSPNGGGGAATPAAPQLGEVTVPAPASAGWTVLLVAGLAALGLVALLVVVISRRKS